jgi:hypothetical protein
MAPDKLTLNLEDSEELAEHLSRMSPGDKMCFNKLEVSLDESDGKLATFSVTEANVDPKYKDKDSKPEEPDDDEPEPMAVKWKRGKDQPAKPPVDDEEEA